MTKIGDAKRKIHGMITGKPDNFSWVIDRKLAGSAIPTSKEEVDWSKQEGIKSIVTIREEPLEYQWLDDVNYLHIHSNDMGVPEFDDLIHSVDFIHRRLENNEPVMVHCLAGIGRTGTILACYLIKYEKLSSDEAITRIRKQRPGSIQSYVQLSLIHI